jgi:hypothetical protein
MDTYRYDVTQREVSPGSWGAAQPIGWQDETLDIKSAFRRRIMRVLIAAIDAWRGQRRDWRAGARW